MMCWPTEYHGLPAELNTWLKLENYRTTKPKGQPVLVWMMRLLTAPSIRLVYSIGDVKLLAGQVWVQARLNESRQSENEIIVCWLSKPSTSLVNENVKSYRLPNSIGQAWSMEMMDVLTANREGKPDELNWWRGGCAKSFCQPCWIR